MLYLCLSPYGQGEEMTNKLWTTDDLAKQSGYSTRQIRRYIRDGIIEGIKAGRDWVVSEDEARRWLESLKGESDDTTTDNKD